MIEAISAAVLPCVFLAAAIPMLSRKKDFFALFTAGAKDGLNTAVRLLPTMIALTVALGMFRASGAVDLLTHALGGIAAVLGIPADILPLLVTRPISGSASTAAYADLLTAVGADSFAALCASVLMGSSDTLVYIVTVYFSGTGSGGKPPVRRTRHAFFAASLVMLLCVFLSCAVSRIFFSPSGA